MTCLQLSSSIFLALQIYIVSSAFASQYNAEKEYMSRVLYASEVGSLMYIMVCTRLDLTHDVSVVSRFVHGAT